MASSVDYEELLRRLRRYRDERDWRQFHTPANLAVAVNVEAGELLEHFLWLTGDDGAGGDDELAGEIADIAIYLLFLCDALGVDLLEVAARKLDHNLERHPVGVTRGRSRPDA